MTDTFGTKSYHTVEWNEKKKKKEETLILNFLRHG